MRRSQNLSVPTADQPRLPTRTRFVLFTSTGPNNADVHPTRGSYHQLAGSPKLKSGPGDRSQWVWQDHGNVGERALSLLTRWCLRTCKVQLVDLEVVLLVHRVPRTTATPVITEKLLFGHFRLETKVVKFIHHVLVCVRTWFEQNQSPVDASFHGRMGVSWSPVDASFHGRNLSGKRMTGTETESPQATTPEDEEGTRSAQVVVGLGGKAASPSG